MNDSSCGLEDVAAGSLFELVKRPKKYLHFFFYASLYRYDYNIGNSYELTASSLFHQQSGIELPGSKIIN
jgi:hypothetical protein